MGFKEQIQKDLNHVFFNQDEFAEEHSFDGNPIVCVIETNCHQRPPGFSESSYPGVYQGSLIIYCQQEAIGYMPEEGQKIDLDGQDYYVFSALDQNGMLEIKLEANLS